MASNRNRKMLSKAIKGHIPAPFTKNIEENQCSDTKTVRSEEKSVQPAPSLLLNADEETVYTKVPTTAEAEVVHKIIKSPMLDEMMTDAAISMTPRRFKTKIRK